ncbi:MAG: methyltransferase domain-containing protein [Terriglobales bacterium]
MDVGGDPNLWSIIGRTQGVIVLNLWYQRSTSSSPYILGDGRRLPFADKSLDVAFSNSAIQHLSLFQDQERFASELWRAAKRILSI